MVSGHLCRGVANDDLMLRVGPDRYAEALARPYARVMDFARTPLEGYVDVAPAGLETDEALAHWIGRGLAFVETLPPE